MNEKSLDSISMLYNSNFIYQFITNIIMKS